MNEKNPYGFDDDIDADLWDTAHTAPTMTPGGKLQMHPQFADHIESVEHHIPHTGSDDDLEPCASCGKIHNVPAELSQLPKQMHKMLRLFLNTFEQGHVAMLASKEPDTVPEALRLLASMMSFAHDVSSSGHGMPMIRAVAEVLDERTDGEVSKRFEVYLLEQRVITSHMVLKIVNGFVEGLRADQRNGEGKAVVPPAVVATAEHMLGYYKAVLDEYVDGYHKACEKAELVPDDHLCENGRYENKKNPFTQYLMHDGLLPDHN